MIPPPQKAESFTISILLFCKAEAKEPIIQSKPTYELSLFFPETNSMILGGVYEDSHTLFKKNHWYALHRAPDESLIQTFTWSATTLKSIRLGIFFVYICSRRKNQEYISSLPSAPAQNSPTHNPSLAI